MKYRIPYGNKQIEFEAPQRSVIFTGEMTSLPKVEDLKGAIIYALDNPIGTPPLKELAKGKKKIVFLVEDSTRDTPVAEIMPVVTGYLNDNGIQDDAMSFLTAPVFASTSMSSALNVYAFGSLTQKRIGSYREPKYFLAWTPELS